MQHEEMPDILRTFQTLQAYPVEIPFVDLFLPSHLFMQPLIMCRYIHMYILLFAVHARGDVFALLSLFSLLYVKKL
jgi:hypothetical protein